MLLTYDFREGHQYILNPAFEQNLVTIYGNFYIHAVAIVYMVDSKRQKSISSDARDAYLKCALAVLRIGRELKKPLPELDSDAVSDSIKEIEKAVPLIENVPVEDIAENSIEEVSQEGDLSS
ncbi:MAG: hypothetical protein QW292_11995 [Candidatus Parvarchaeota archaeon]